MEKELGMGVLLLASPRLQEAVSGGGKLAGGAAPPCCKAAWQLLEYQCCCVLLVSCFCLDHVAFCFHSPQTGAVLRPKPGARRSCWNPPRAWSPPGPVRP